MTQMIVDFSSKIMEARRQWKKAFKVLKEKTIDQKLEI